MATAVEKLVEAYGQRFGSFIYCCQGRLPWTLGYGAYRSAYIERLIRHEESLEYFQEVRELPDGFGMRLDERVIEYPWAFSKLRTFGEKSRLLDAGSTFNHHMILRHPAIERHNWTILTLAPESKCFWDRGISYIYDDLRSTPLRDGWFDAVFCISVIEHVGMDNFLYTAERSYRENRPQDYLYAIAEMKRVLRPQGWLFLTVPFGRYENHGWLQQFDTAMLSSLISHFQPQSLRKTFFRYTERGWKLAIEDQCRDLAYFDIHASKFSKSKQPKRFDSDFAAAARGLACLELQK